MPAIQLDGVAKQFDGVTAVDDLSLTVPEGEVFGFLGPNGAGKSTTINMLLDFVRPTAGTVSVLGMDAQARSVAVRERAGVLPEGFSVYNRLTGRQHIEFAIESKGVDADPDAVLERVGLDGDGDRKAGGYSKGMGQRLALGMALVGDPDLLILDEPTAGVDVQLRRDLWDVVRELNENGTTVLLTTHYIEEAERLCDRVAVMDEGQVLDVATPADLMSRGTDTITVRVAEPPGSLPPLDVDGVIEASVDGDRLEFRVEDGGGVVADLLTALQATGHEVRDLDVSRTSLEEIFVEMTGDDASTARSDADHDSDHDHDSDREDAEVTSA